MTEGMITTGGKKKGHRGRRVSNYELFIRRENFHMSLLLEAPELECAEPGFGRELPGILFKSVDIAELQVRQRK